MHQIKRIIELYQEGRNIWETKRLTGLSRNTVREYLRRIQGSGLSPAQLLALDEDSLIPIVYGEDFEQSHGGRKADERYQTIAAFFICEFLQTHVTNWGKERKPDNTLTRHWK